MVLLQFSSLLNFSSFHSPDIKLVTHEVSCNLINSTVHRTLNEVVMT
jgi:hypothetical protein